MTYYKYKYKYLIVKKVHCKGIKPLSPQLVFEALLPLS